MTDYSYKNIQHAMSGGNKVTRKVAIKGTNGYKSVIIHKNGKKHHSKRRKLSNQEIDTIKAGKFIPGLFSNLMVSSKTRKHK
jgi:predicted aspartyl protease